MSLDARYELAHYRIEKAEECYQAAAQLIENKFYRDSANRSYYAIFNAIRAVLALDQVDFKKHSAVISYFQQHYVKTQLFEIKYSDYIRDAFSVRQFCDYQDFYVVVDSEVQAQLSHARELLDAVTSYLRLKEQDEANG